MAGHGGARPGAGRKPKRDLSATVTVADRPKTFSTTEIVAAVPDEALERVLRALPENVTAHELLKAVIQAKDIPAPIRMHAAAKVLPYEVARPTATKDAGTGGLMIKLSRHGAASD